MLAPKRACIIYFQNDYIVIINRYEFRWRNLSLFKVIVNLWILLWANFFFFFLSAGWHYPSPSTLTQFPFDCSVRSDPYKYNMLPPLPAQRNLTPPPTLYPQQPVSVSENYSLPRFALNGSAEVSSTARSRRSDINVWWGWVLQFIFTFQDDKVCIFFFFFLAFDRLSIMMKMFWCSFVCSFGICYTDSFKSTSPSL